MSRTTGTWRIALRNGCYDAAIALAENVPREDQEQNPHHLRFIATRAAALALSGEPQQAVSLLEQEMPSAEARPGPDLRVRAEFLELKAAIQDGDVERIKADIDGAGGLEPFRDLDLEVIRGLAD